MDLTGLDVHLAGPWLDLPEDSPLRDWTAPELDNCVDNRQTAEIYRQPGAASTSTAAKPRTPTPAKAGRAGPARSRWPRAALYFPRDPRPESDELFAMLPSYSSPEEASDLLRWALARPEQRAEAAAKARAAIEGPHLQKQRQGATAHDRARGRKMARSHGRNGSVYLGVTSGAAASPVTFQASWTLNMTVDKQDVTAFGDGNKIYVAGLPDASGDFSGFWTTPQARPTSRRSTAWRGTSTCTQISVLILPCTSSVPFFLISRWMGLSAVP